VGTIVYTDARDFILRGGTGIALENGDPIGLEKSPAQAVPEMFPVREIAVFEMRAGVFFPAILTPRPHQLAPVSHLLSPAGGFLFFSSP
jgi:hypothetical protein